MESLRKCDAMTIMEGYTETSIEAGTGFISTIQIQIPSHLIWIQLVRIYKYKYIYTQVFSATAWCLWNIDSGYTWNLFVLYFEAATLRKKAFSVQTRHYLGSRYTLRIWYVLFNIKSSMRYTTHP